MFNQRTVESRTVIAPGNRSPDGDQAQRLALGSVSDSPPEIPGDYAAAYAATLGVLNASLADVFFRHLRNVQRVRPERVGREIRGSIQDLEVDRGQVEGRGGVALEVLAAAVEVPVGIPVVVEADGAEVEKSLGAGSGPTQAGLHRPFDRRRTLLLARRTCHDTQQLLSLSPYLRDSGVGRGRYRVPPGAGKLIGVFGIRRRS